jgi:VWFA-related protein
LRPSSSTLVVAGLATTLVFGGGRSVHSGRQQAQTPPTPTFKIGTNLVQVDAIVHDDRGNFVMGLAPEDLEIYENGVLQRIEQMYVVARDVETGLVSTTGAASRRVFVLVFDEADLEISSLHRIKKGAEQFLTTHFKQGDLGGVVVDGQFHRGRLTTDKILLLGGIRALKPAFDSRDARLRPFREFPRIPGEGEAVRIVAGDSFLVRDLGQQACRDDAQACSRAGGLEMIENKLQQKARLYVAQSRDATRNTLDALRMATSAVAHLPGRKTIVFFSDGFFVEEARSEVRQLAGSAARVGATIYGIDGRGLVAGKGPMPDVVSRERPIDGSSDTSGDGPEMLADATGGFVVRRTDDVGKALKLIAQDTSSYYVLGYRPVDSVMNGTFRKITVKATSSALTVRARRGYVATPLPPQITK